MTFPHRRSWPGLSRRVAKGVMKLSRMDDCFCGHVGVTKDAVFTPYKGFP
ncbi:hypothetical protein AA103587_0583 [Gluconobacter kanchanaburiensis NBRC 103587]|nr:hypothetical protein AA103587_0583 [Gluconobacter kanchanaburiensis NBRC 103587]